MIETTPATDQQTSLAAHSHLSRVSRSAIYSHAAATAPGSISINPVQQLETEPPRWRSDALATHSVKPIESASGLLMSGIGIGASWAPYTRTLEAGFSGGVVRWFGVRNNVAAVRLPLQAERVHSHKDTEYHVSNNLGTDSALTPVQQQPLQLPQHPA